MGSVHLAYFRHCCLQANSCIAYYPAAISKDMKRIYLYLIGVFLTIVLIYIWVNRNNFSLLRARLTGGQVESSLETHSGQLAWRRVDQTAQGFKIEMPGEPRSTTAQALNETGTSDSISMLMVKPDSDRTYAVAWADKPPVARVNDLVPETTLDQARDGALNRTQTTLVSEIRSTPQGFPGRDFVARNVEGGVLDARIIYAGTRLYMLIATSPSDAARREQDIVHFFNSFSIAGNTQVPETVPPATR